MRTFDAGSVLAAVSIAYGVTIEQIMSPRRSRTWVRARWAAYWLLRQTGLGYAEIGRIMSRDHTSVIHGMSRVNADREMLAECEYIGRQIADSLPGVDYVLAMCE